MMSAATGGCFWTGFAAGALSSIAASAWSADLNGAKNAGMGWAGNARSSGLGMVAFGTVAGGAGAQLTGGNFWVGAATGLMVSACNHYVHEIRVAQQNKTFEDGLRSVLKSAKTGEEINSKELISKYGIPKKAANLINSFTKTSENTIKVDWSNGLSMSLAEKLSDAVFKDGTININYQKNGTLQLSGNAIGIEFEGKIYHNLFLNGNFAKIPGVSQFKWEIGL